MIPIVYFRSSSFNAHRGCETDFYINYILGHTGVGGKKADKGTMVHKVLEIFALCKKAQQDGEDEIDDSLIGKVDATNQDEEYLDEVANRVYDYYTSRIPHHEWLPLDKKHIVKWTRKAMNDYGGAFNPFNRDVVAVEPHFDFEIDQEWAEYDYADCGLKGKLALKGTIDLITNLGDGVYEVVDYKTGMRTDWATGKIKDEHSLYSDPQLRIYHYACKKMFPEANTFIVTIYFINRGGPFTIHFHDSDLEKTEALIKKRYDYIKETEIPKTVWQVNPKQSWKCRRICHLGRSTFEGTNIEPIIEKRFGQKTKYGDVMTKCEQIRYFIDKHGIDWVTENMIKDGHSFSFYKNPGEVD